MNFHVTYSDAYEVVLKDLLDKCKMPSKKTHQGLKFLITLRGVPIGGARLILSKNGKSGLVASVCVLEEFRSLGAGKILMQNLKQTAIDLGVSHLYLAAVDKATHFYHKLGYIPISPKHRLPSEFVKPVFHIWKEYESGLYPYRITEYLHSVI